MNNTFRPLMIWLFVFAALVTLLITIKGTSSTTAEVGFNDVFRFGEQNLIKELKISAESVEGVFHEPQMIDGTKVEKFKSEYIFYEGFIPQVLKWNTPFKVDNNTSAKVILSMLGWVLPIGLIVVLWVFFLRQMQAGGNKAELARTLHMSRPTLYARLDALQRVLGLDLDDAESRTSLHVAMLVLG